MVNEAVPQFPPCTNLGKLIYYLTQIGIQLYIRFDEAPLVGILSEAPCFALRIGKIPMPPVGGKDWIRGRKLGNPNIQLSLIFE